MDIYKESDLYNRSTGIKEGTHQIYDYTICDYCGERLPDKMFDDEYLTTTFYKIYETAMIEPWFDQIDITKDIDRYDFFNNNDKFHFHSKCEAEALMKCIKDYEDNGFGKPLLYLYTIKSNMIRKKLNKKELTIENIKL